MEIAASPLYGLKDSKDFMKILDMNGQPIVVQQGTIRVSADFYR